MATLYVTEPGARIEREYRRILVTKQGDVMVSVPEFKVDQIVLVGSVGITTPALIQLLQVGIGLTITTNSGQILGKLSPYRSDNIELKKHQYACTDNEDIRINFSRDIVRGKLRNYRMMAQRMLRAYARQGFDQQELMPSFTVIENCIQKLAQADSADVIRGLEGVATRAYFFVFRKSLDKTDELGFQKRIRHPPGDPVNALLGLGYTLLTNAMVTACEVVGLDPCIGFFHTEKNGRPSLALDLIEEFRPIIVDSIVLRMINQRVIKLKDFEPGEKYSCTLTKSGLKKFFTQFNARLHSIHQYPAIDRPLTFQKIFELQARQVKKIILGEEKHYAYLRMR